MNIMVKIIMLVPLVVAEPLLIVLERIISLLMVNGEQVCAILRGFLFQIYLGTKNLKIGSNVKFVNPQNISLGRNIRLHSGSSYITSKKSKIIIGDNSHVGRLSVFAGAGGIEVGANCAISGGVIIYSITNVTDDPTKFVTEQSKTEKVVIGDNVLIGAGVIILPGVRIGNHSILGAGAVINKDVSDYEVVVGVPGKMIGKRSYLI